MSKITESARGEQCQLRIPGICTGNQETVVWCHAIGHASGKGIGKKSPDVLGAYGCQNCHDCYDRRTQTPSHLTRQEIEICFSEGHQRSMRILIEKGLVKV